MFETLFMLRDLYSRDTCICSEWDWKPWFFCVVTHPMPAILGYCLMSGIVQVPCVYIAVPCIYQCTRCYNTLKISWSFWFSHRLIYPGKTIHRILHCAKNLMSHNNNILHSIKYKINVELTKKNNNNNIGSIKHVSGYNNSIVIVDFFFCVCGQCHNTAWEKNCSGVIMIWW